MNIKNFILKHSPIFVQNIAITFYNSYLYKQRHKNKYVELFSYYSNFDNTNQKEINTSTKVLLNAFLSHSTKKSKWYKDHSGKSLCEFPILTKNDLINNLDVISTISDKEGHTSLTGGTTGASLKVKYTSNDKIERQAILDSFRAQYGYKLGAKTAWFSGKEIVREKDITQGNCHRDDFINKIRFFSTFYISRQNFDIYWTNFTQYRPEYIIGFPSSIYDLCLMAKERGLTFHGYVKVFFPTAESMLEEQKTVIKSILDCEIVDQYASSEGAPFILQCKKGNMHIHPLTGIFEILDENNEPSDEGELIVTAFHTHGTPLIRYRIGDRVKLADTDYSCPCNSLYPVVEKIIGRNNDFIWSEERGRVNLGNISNSTKDVNGILCFQIIQDSHEEILVKLVSNELFSKEEQSKFIQNLQNRIGTKIQISLTFVDNIPREKSGKFRIVKNSLSLQKY